jgi:hypothetical protein
MGNTRQCKVRQGSTWNEIQIKERNGKEMKDKKIHANEDVARNNTRQGKELKKHGKVRKDMERKGT